MTCSSKASPQADHFTPQDVTHSLRRTATTKFFAARADHFTPQDVTHSLRRTATKKFFAAIAWSFACLILVVGSSALAEPLPKGFTLKSSGPPWQANIAIVPDGFGSLEAAIVASFAGNVRSEPGQFVAASIEVEIPKSGPAELSFRFADTFSGPTAGYHFAEVLIGETVIFERDVAGGTDRPQDVRLDIRKALPHGGKATLAFRLGDRKTVTNFPIEVRFMEPVLTTADGRRKLLPPVAIESPEPLPADLPMPSLPLAGEDWTRTTRIVQPWGQTQWEAVVRADRRAPWLANDFGFDAVIILPPEAHNAITDDAHHVTEKQFDAAMDAYRKAGFRIILYSSIMHCGHAPIWQEGSLSRDHPEWSQRGPEGEPVTIYGHEWLCPSTGALPFTIDYTRRIVERYGADAVMLDNNEFFTTPSGLTCHCTGCRDGFREYLKLRFGETVFAEPCNEVDIPTQAGPLYGLWLHWRNRVWAEATERFRVELRAVKPGIVVLANTQYLRSSPDLATDLQYGHEDALLSESRNKTLQQMVDKLLLGRALAADRPLWNYLGTFQDGDFGRLVSPGQISINISTAFACRARPWVVYYGFFEKPGENGASLERMAQTLKWHVAKDGEFQGLKPYPPVLSLVSPTSRNLRGTRLIPSHLTPLRKAGFCVRLVDERALPDGALDDCLVLLIETAPCMSRESIAAVAAFVRSGGRLIASADTGLYDEIGRPRPSSLLWPELGLPRAPVEPTRCGKGQVVAKSLSDPTDEMVRWLEPARVTLEPAADAAILPYLDANGKLVVYVCADNPLPEGIKVTASLGISGVAVICSPDCPQPRIIELISE